MRGTYLPSTSSTGACPRQALPGQVGGRVEVAVDRSEEKAREPESDPRRQEGMKAMRATMMEIIDGAAEFVDLSIMEETSL
jgi:hypothetical protein